jgi:hypothetical protein
MKCKTPVGLKFFKCRFVGIYKGLPLLNPVFGVIQQPVKRASTRSSWLGYPEWIVGSSLLDIALNKEWPKHDSD